MSTKQRRYSHQFVIAYSLDSDHPEAEDLTRGEHIAAIAARGLEIDADTEGWREAMGPPQDTYEHDCDAPEGWPQECEDIHATG